MSLEKLNHFRIWLASKSPRRRDLIERLGLKTSIVEIDHIETVDDTWESDEIAEQLAVQKSLAFEGQDLLSENDILLTADTVVAHQGAVLHKPDGREGAIDMLRALSGSTHFVHTGVCLRTSTHSISFTETTAVDFAPLTSEEILHYVDNFQPFDKAGAYGIQEWIGYIGVKGIRGCYYNVMGLPLHALYNKLNELGS